MTPKTNSMTIDKAIPQSTEVFGLLDKERTGELYRARWVTWIFISKIK